jgi:PAS domain S-box-containing protein
MADKRKPSYEDLERQIKALAHADKESKELHTRLLKAMEIARLGYWEHDIPNAVITLSDALCRIFQITSEQDGEYIISTNDYLHRFVHPDDFSFVKEWMRETRESGESQANRQLEHRFVRADGTVGHLLVRYLHMEFNAGRAVKSFGINQDITEQKENQEKLLHSQKMKSIGTLANGIAHDLNNILQPMLGFCELLHDELPADSSQKEYVEDIFEAGLRARELVDRFLTFGRQPEHHMMPIQVNQVLNEAVKLSRSTIPPNIKISQDISNDPLYILSAPGQLRQIAMDLIINAYHAVDQSGGNISVHLDKETLEEENLNGLFLQPGRYARITVSDTGPGIDPAIMDKIFEPYSTTKSGGEGSGLGLSVVYSIVKAHGGDIRLESEVEKKTTIIVYLPLMKEPPKEVPPEKEAPPEKEETSPAGSEQILFVDDEDLVLKPGRFILERLGYRVVTHTSSLDALEAFKADPNAFDLVITDMSMPNMTGDQLAIQLRALRPDIPVIISTGDSEKVQKSNLDDMSANDFLVKPITIDELSQKVRKLLDISSSKS